MAVCASFAGSGLVWPLRVSGLVPSFESVSMSAGGPASARRGQ